VTVRALAAAGVVPLGIEDTGIGIPKEALKNLGRPFEQVESQLTKSHKGSGLGLAIAKSLVDLHGGSVRIRSTQGVGTIVLVRLPVERSTARADGAAVGGAGFTARSPGEGGGRDPGARLTPAARAHAGYVPTIRMKLARTLAWVSARCGSRVAKSGRSAARARRRRSSLPAVFGSKGPLKHRRST